MRELLRRLPKTDLHCHLDGSVRPQTALELGRRFKIALPADTAEGLRPFVQVAPSCRTLKEFLDVFDLIYPLLRHPDAVERVAYELVEDCAAENIRHVEARFAPELQAVKGFDSEQVIEAALKGLARGYKDFGTTSAVIVCLFRSHGEPENRRAFAALKKSFRRDARPEEPAVVGLDLAGDEARFPTSLYADYYEQARRLGIWTTCHAGETAGTANIKTALELGVLRLGHGTHLGEDPGLVAEAARRRVPLEVGLSSNVRTKAVASLAGHPAAAFYRAGVPITLNTDDRGILGVDLTHEYEQALSAGFSLEDLASIALGSIDHLFLPAEHRARMKESFAVELRRALAPRTAEEVA